MQGMMRACRTRGMTCWHSRACSQATGIELVAAIIQAPADRHVCERTQACQEPSNLALFLIWSGKRVCNAGAPVYTTKLITHTCRRSRNDLH
jgi:hypothetical protein